MTTRFATLSVLSMIGALTGCGDSGTMQPAPLGMMPPVAPAGTMMMPPAAPAGVAGTAAAPITPPVATTTPTPAAAGSGATPIAPPTGMITPVMPVQPPTMPATGAAGSGSPMVMPMPPVTAGPVDPRGKCEINSGYDDDKACLLPPKPDEGLQIHVGPKDYKNMAEVSKFLMQAGDESSQCWTFHTPNESEVFYQTFELTGRAGTHHIINTMFRNQIPDGGFTTCADPGIGTNANIIDNLPGASKAYMARGTVAPENKNVGRKIPAKATSQADMHYFNFTDKTILREFWMNIYFAKKEDITMQAAQIRAMGGLGWTAAPIAPGADMVYKYECPISGNGRILALLGHYHSHGKQFTASIRRSGSSTAEKVFEMFDYRDPATFEYDSVTKNPAFSGSSAGAKSGTLEVKAGDVLMWDCHIVNDGSSPLTYTNEVKTGEMCNLWGSSLGITPINCLLP